MSFTYDVIDVFPTAHYKQNSLKSFLLLSEKGL